MMGDIKRKPPMGRAYRTRDFVTPFHRYCEPQSLCRDDAEFLEVELIRERLRNYRPTSDELVNKYGSWQNGGGT